MDRGRLEAFSDGVFAIIITITVLELHTPPGFDWHALAEEAPTFIAYVLSFAFVAIYWNNHHHLLKTVHQVSASIMWANMILLFWLTLMPFATGWVGASYRDGGKGDHVVPMVVYGIVQFLAGTSYYLLQTLIVKAHGGPESHLGAALGRDWKGHVSPFLYIGGILVSFVVPLAGFAIYSIGAIIWLVPDRRLEKVLREEEFHAHDE